MSRPAIALSLLLALAVSTGTAQPQQDPHALVRMPAWWGGTVPKVEAAVEAAGAWSKSVELPRSGVAQRFWVVQDRSFAVGAVVWSEGDRQARQDAASDVAQARLRTRAMQVRNRVLTGILLPDDGPIERWVLAVSGLQNQRLVGSGGATGGEIDVKARLQSEPVIKEYAMPGRRYLVALLARSALQEGAIAGLDASSVDELQACGMLAAERAEGVSAARVVDAALALATTDAAVGMASMSVRTGRDADAARVLFNRSATGALSIQSEVAAEWGEVARLAGEADSLLGRLGSSSITEDERLETVASSLRSSGLEGEPVVLHTARGQGILLALPAKEATESRLRSWFEVLGGGSGRVRLPELMVLRSGEPGLASAASSQPFARGVAVRVGPTGGWILLEPGETLDPRFVAGQVRVRLPSTERLQRPVAVQRAAALHAAQVGFWQQISSGVLASALELPGLQEHVVWAVEDPSGAWSIDFLPGLSNWLCTAGTPAPFRYHLAAQGKEPEGFADDLARALGMDASASGSAQEADVTIEVVLEAMSPEKGEDPGTGFVAKKPWARQSVVARVLLQNGADRRALQATETTPKVYGGGDLAPHAARAGAKALRALTEDIPAACRKLLGQPSLVVVEHVAGAFPRDVREAAAGFGPVAEEPVDTEAASKPNAPSQAPSGAAKVAGGKGANDAEKRFVRTRFSWPGGEAGFRRTLPVRNMAGLPALPPGSMFRPVRPGTPKINPLDR